MDFYVAPHLKVKSDLKDPKTPFTESVDDLEITTNSPYGKLDSLETIKCAKSLVFTTPTPIQKYAIPVVLNNHPLLCRAPTGLGKTLCFLLPLIENITYLHGLKVCIVAPTRELCSQIGDEAKKISSKAVVECAFGGFKRLSSYSNVNVLIAAPGRLLDLLNSGAINFSFLTNFVLDEADKLMEMGFEKEIRCIRSFMPQTATTFLFSATYHAGLFGIINEFLPSHKISIEVKNETLSNIKQSFSIVYNKDEKLKELLLQNLAQKEKILVFAEKKTTVQELEDRIRGWGHAVASLHGDKPQPDRQWSLNQFKKKDVNVLVATSVAARGIDVKDIKMVINYDFPKDIKEYIHRIGRTGRQGKEGIAISFMNKDISPETKSGLVSILKESGTDIPSFLVQKEYKESGYQNKGNRFNKNGPVRKGEKNSKNITKSLEELSIGTEKEDSAEDLPGEW